MLWPDHCVQGTWGEEIEESIQSELASWEKRGLVVKILKVGGAL
jgi:nicotinamidase-related amidase